MITRLPGPTDTDITPSKGWQLAVTDPDLPQHTWWIGKVGAPPPAMDAPAGEFSPEWPAYWREWEQPGRGQMNIVMRELPPKDDESVHLDDLFDPNLVRISPPPQVVLLLDPPWLVPPVTRPTPNSLRLIKYQLGIQSAYHDWRLICPQVFTEYHVPGPARTYVTQIRLEASDRSDSLGNLYSVYLARPPEAS